MLDNILFILGIKSYDVSFPFVSKKDLFVDEKSIFPYEKFKLLYKLKLIKYSENENEDEFNVGILPKISLKPNTFDKFFYAFYTLYFLAVSVLLWTQCVYNFSSWIYTNDIRHLVSFFTHINVPIIHIWSKRYFMSNHMEKILNCKKFKTIIISLFTLFSILANFVDTPAFNNHYMWPIVITNNDYIFYICILIDWFYSRLLCFLFLFTVVFILKQHVSEIDKLKDDLSTPEEYFLENACINNLIIDVSATKDKISKTIHLLNPIISFSTLIGAANLSLFIRTILPTNNVTYRNIFDNLIPFDRYLFVCSMIYTLMQSCLLFYIYLYASKRESILDHVKSHTFIKSFLYRLPLESLNFKDIPVINLSTVFDTANSVEWLILCDILSNRWVDFTIFGISTSDGKLLIKGITLGGVILFIITFIAK
jgi:hypothetical protein